MTVESVAEFYAQTDSGKFLVQRGREAGRQEGREAMLADVLRERFGPDDRIVDLAHRLVQDPGALRAVLAADSLDDLDASS